MNVQKPLPTRDQRLNQFLYFLLAVILLLIAGTTALQTNCIIVNLQGGGQRYYCDGLPAIWFRDQLNTPNGLITYAQYPFEYFVVAGGVQIVINTFMKFVANMNDAGVIYFSNFVMAFFALASVILLYKFKVTSKRALAFVITPVTFIFALNFDYIQIFLIILSLYLLLQRKNTTLSALTYGLACLVKGYPLLFIPLLYKETTSKLKFTLTALGTFGAGLFAQYALNPTNFLHATSYLTSYGLEGSFLSFFFPQDVINYQTTTTWIIGNGTQIPLPHTYQIVSGLLFLGALALIYFRGKSLPVFDKFFLGFASALIFLWISAPQMVLNLVILAPLTLISVNKLNLTLWNLMSIFSCDILVVGDLLQFRGSLDSLYVQILSMGFLILLLANAYLRPRPSPLAQTVPTV